MEKTQELSAELKSYGLRNPVRTASLVPVLDSTYKAEPLTFKQRIRNMNIGYHATMIGLKLAMAVLFAVGVTALLHPDEMMLLFMRLIGH